jgi:hypothetical protein
MLSRIEEGSNPRAVEVHNGIDEYESTGSAPSAPSGPNGYEDDIPF